MNGMTTMKLTLEGRQSFFLHVYIADEIIQRHRPYTGEADSSRRH